MDQPWDFFGFDEESYNNFISTYWESEKTKNQTRGRALAEIELSRREFLDSGKSENSGKSEKFLWVTVNPKPETNLDVFVKTIHKMYSKKWISNSAYIFETTENGHFHSHGIIKCNYEFARAKKELANTVSNMCMVSNTHCLKIVLITEDVAIQKFNYMNGKKTQKKIKHVEISKTWRSTNKLQEIYFSNAPLTLLGAEESCSSV